MFGSVPDIYPAEKGQGSEILAKCQELKQSAPWKEFNILAYNVQMDLSSLLSCNDESFMELDSSVKVLQHL